MRKFALYPSAKLSFPGGADRRLECPQRKYLAHAAIEQPSQQLTFSARGKALRKSFHARFPVRAKDRSIGISSAWFKRLRLPTLRGIIARRLNPSPKAREPA
jgi:hypothetical protein